MARLKKHLLKILAGVFLITLLFFIAKSVSQEPTISLLYSSPQGLAVSLDGQDSWGPFVHPTTRLGTEGSTHAELTYTGIGDPFDIGLHDNWIAGGPQNIEWTTIYPPGAGQHSVLIPISTLSAVWMFLIDNEGRAGSSASPHPPLDVVIHSLALVNVVEPPPPAEACVHVIDGATMQLWRDLFDRWVGAPAICGSGEYVEEESGCRYVWDFGEC